jgi:hypothetical protein
VVEVRVEATSLEQIYFDIMGVRPGADDEAIAIGDEVAAAGDEAG